MDVICYIMYDTRFTEFITIDFSCYMWFIVPSILFANYYCNFRSFEYNDFRTITIITSNLALFDQFIRINWYLLTAVLYAHICLRP